MKHRQLWWIKERHNPQTGIYYVKYGQLSKAAAKRHQRCLYGDNYMLSFESEAVYLEKITLLKKAGERIQ